MKVKMDREDNRRAVYRLPRVGLLRVFDGSTRIVFPEGTRIVSMHDEVAYDGLTLVLENPSWPSVAPGATLPALSSELVTRYAEDIHVEAPRQ